MSRLVLLISLALGIGPAYAQLSAPGRTSTPGSNVSRASASSATSTRAVAAITDPKMVVRDRGADLEVFPSKRAVPSAGSGGHAGAHQVTETSADSAIGPQQLGVVFNHSTQQRGYISGEIVFKMKAGHTLGGFDSSLYPGLKKILDPEVYASNARTPAEFLEVLKRLQAREDLEWVEPTVIYGGVVNDSVDNQSGIR